jgi:hypothetical protein
VAELFELLGQSLGAAFGVAVSEVVAAEISVGLAGAEHVPDGADDGVLDGSERFLVAASGSESLVLGVEVGPSDADGGERDFFERPVEPL